jgi:acetoin utilization protein AcuB
MLVMDWMSKEVIMVDADDSMQDAMKLLKDHDIKMLPVMAKQKLVGIVTDRDLKRSSASDATTLEIHELLYLISNIKVKEIMTKNPITVPVDFTVEETAQVLLKNKISGAPVVDPKGNIVGTITKEDLFRAIISLTGVDQKGVQFALQSEDRPGSITELINIIREYDGRIMSILSSIEHAPEGFRRVYIRTYDIDRRCMENLKNALSKKAKILYWVDHRENKRMIY